MRKFVLVSLATLTLAGCQSVEGQRGDLEYFDDQRCLQYGAPRGTREYARCRRDLERSRYAAPAPVYSSPVYSGPVYVERRVEVEPIYVRERPPGYGGPPGGYYRPGPPPGSFGPRPFPPGPPPGGYRPPPQQPPFVGQPQPQPRPFPPPGTGPRPLPPQQPPVVNNPGPAPGPVAPPQIVRPQPQPPVIAGPPRPPGPPPGGGAGPVNPRLPPCGTVPAGLPCRPA